MAHEDRGGSAGRSEDRPHPAAQEAVRVTAGGVALDGDLARPPRGGGVVLFAHGSGSSRHSPRNRRVAEHLQRAELGTGFWEHSIYAGMAAGAARHSTVGFLAIYHTRSDQPFPIRVRAGWAVNRPFGNAVPWVEETQEVSTMRVPPESSAITDLWSYRDTAKSQTTDLVGFQVVATDGAIGNLDAATYDVGGSYIVVDTGFWIFGKKRMLPAGVIDRIDYDVRKVHVNLTKDQIREAPDYDAEREREEAYRQDIGTYYGPYFYP